MTKLKTLISLIVIGIVAVGVVGCGSSSNEPDPMTAPKANNVDPSTMQPETQVDREGKEMKPKAPTTNQAAGGQTDRMGNPSGG